MALPEGVEKARCTGRIYLPQVNENKSPLLDFMELAVKNQKRMKKPEKYTLQFHKRARIADHSLRAAVLVRNPVSEGLIRHYDT